MSKKLKICIRHEERFKGSVGNPCDSSFITCTHCSNPFSIKAANEKYTCKTCGICHFNGGGGNNVKHGDLEQSLLDCSRDVDVHMSVEGGNMQCVDCHTTENHNIMGKLYSVSAANTNRIICEWFRKTTRQL